LARTRLPARGFAIGVSALRHGPVVFRRRFSVQFAVRRAEASGGMSTRAGPPYEDPRPGTEALALTRIKSLGRHPVGSGTRTLVRYPRGMTERPRLTQREPRSLQPEQMGQLTISTPAALGPGNRLAMHQFLDTVLPQKPGLHPLRDAPTARFADGCEWRRCSRSGSGHGPMCASFAWALLSGCPFRRS
jgi:hypothetical protein